MAVYKFKIVIEDNEDIYREIDILSGQTFEDFHIAIQDAFKFDKKHAASFFVSDDYWRKDQEITLHKEDLALDSEEIRKGVPDKKLMSATKIAKYIDNPRQRFLYVFDPSVKWTFCIELMKILPDNPKGSYPSCVKSIGNPPKQYKVVSAPKAIPGLEGLTPAVHDEMDESEIYKAIKNDTNGIDEGDLNHLEGEEGEEQEEENENEFGDDEDDMEDGHDNEYGDGHDED